MINRRELGKLIPWGCAISGLVLQSNLATAAVPNKFTHIRRNIYNRGRPKEDFLEKLVTWGRAAPDEVFARNSNYDVYSHVSYRLGPWRNDLHRRAVMLEVLRVLGGFESAWKWDAGPDIGAPGRQTDCTKEAGIFQCSGNSMNFDKSLKDLLVATSGADDCRTFRETSKNNHTFALEYCARLLRFTVRHHGPLKRRHNSRIDPRKSSIHPFLLKEAVREFEQLLS